MSFENRPRAVARITIPGTGQPWPQVWPAEWGTGGGNYEGLLISEGTLTMDKGALPYVSGTITVPLVEESLAEQLDPYKTPRVTVLASTNATDERAFDLVIIGREVSHDGKKVTLTVGTDEALLQRYRTLIDDAGPIAHQSSLRSVINYVLAVVIPDAALEYGTVDADVSAFTDAAPELLIWEAGTDAWSFLATVVNAARLWLHCDEDRRWTLVDPAEFSLPGRVVAQLSNTSKGTDTIDTTSGLRASGIIARFSWRDIDGNQQTRDDTAGGAGEVLLFEFRRPYPGPGTAAMLLSKMQGQGRTQDVTVGATYDVTPGMESGISLPGTRDQLGTLQSVRWDLAAGVMDLESKGLIEVVPGSWLAWDAEEAWQDVAPALEWEDA